MTWHQPQDKIKLRVGWIDRCGIVFMDAKGFDSTPKINDPIKKILSNQQVMKLSLYSEAHQDKIKLQQIAHDKYQKRKLYAYYNVSQMGAHW